MRRFVKYIAVVVAMFVVNACTIADIDTPVKGGVSQSANSVQLISRVAPFTDYDVATRATKTPEETYVSQLEYIIFDANNTCVFYQHVDGNESVAIDRESEWGAEYKNNDALKSCTIFVIANYPEIYEKICAKGWENNSAKGKTYAELSSLGLKTSVNGIYIDPTLGLPMYGQYVANNGSTTVDFTADIASGTSFVTTLTSLYSKIVFNIGITADQTMPNYPMFEIEGFDVYGLPKTVDLTSGTEGSTNDMVEVWKDEDELKAFAGELAGNTTTIHGGGNTIPFSFYLPERFLVPNTKASEYAYPFKKDSYEGQVVDKNGNGIRDEDERYMQRYKPCLVEGQDATFVRFYGTYTDHQGMTYNVSYDIFIGNDNYSNFDVVRNRQYNNSVTIRGLATSSDQTTSEESISIDHRVNVERTLPGIVNLRRETLLDSHFEVRPLRIRKNENHKSVGQSATHARVSITDNNSSPMVRLEYKDIDGGNTARYLSNGKRKYFTSGLVSGNEDGTLNGSTSCVVELSEVNQTIWLYVDECLEYGDGIRTAIVTVEYGSGTGANFKRAADCDPIEYEIKQRKLFEVFYDENNDNTQQSSERKYYIEYHEEYLYNYDAEDSFNQTEQEGMAWGLNGSQLSFDHQSIAFNDGLQNWLTSGARPYYDFYITKHDKNDAETSKGTLHDHTGFEFCDEIITDVNTNTSERDGANNTANDIKVLNLNDKPKSAVEYCYNKNKRNSKGEVQDVVWYLPSVDEIEDVIMSSYKRSDTSDIEGVYLLFKDFQNKFYWSCQPAYIRNFTYYQGISNSRDSWGPVYIDNVNYARATKVDYKVVRVENGVSVYDYVYAYSGIEPGAYYNGTWFKWGGILGTNTYTPADGTVTFDNRSDVTITFKEVSATKQEGYLHRTNDMARIRCVRKMN